MRSLIIGFAFLLTAAPAQTPPKAESDILLLTDGEKLIGQFVRANGGTVRFKSDALGEITVDWSKVKELHSARQFAVVTKDVRIRRRGISGEIPKGTLDMTDQKLQVAGAAETKTIPVPDAAHVVDEPTFEKVFVSNPNFFRGWRGTITAGASLVEATQNSRAFNESVALIRAVPAEDWVPRRNRTSLNFTSSYGLVSQSNTPSVKTSIFHVDSERDEYFSASAYGFGQALFDHNFSQGLDLQQTFVGGIGWTILKRANQTLDLKAGISYIRQQFSGSTASQNLASSVFDEKFLRKFAKGLTFTQEFSVSPAWTNTRALSALGNATLTIPVYKRFAFNTGVVDSFLNDPPAGFKRNSFQLNTGLTYVLQ